MIDYLKALKEVNIQFTGPGILDFINNMSFPVATVTVALLILLAIQGYKIFKSLAYVFASIGLGFAGHLYIAPKVSGMLASKIPENIPVDVDVAIAFVCAMIGVVLAHFAHNFIVFCMGGAAGYCIGFFFVSGLLANHFSNLTFLQNMPAKIAVGVVCALLVAIIFLLVYKYLYMFISSIGFMGLACYILARQIMPGHDLPITVCFVAVGIVIGIFMMIHQYDEDVKTMEFKF